MPTCPPIRTIRSGFLLAWLLALLTTGCRQAEQFDADLLWSKANNLTDSQVASIQLVLAKHFGKPDAPLLPPGKASQLFELERLEQASGKVISEEVGITQGLYGRHCARCHGITGNGRGPTALYQSPYPRDFRRGIFKWKSTYRVAKPTNSDLLHTVEHGIAGTSMPSFQLLTDDERKTLVDYVKYLSLRGELEQELITYVAEDLEIDESLAIDDPEIVNLLDAISQEWLSAESNILPVDAAVMSSSSIDRGKELYASERAGCMKCHGKEGAGDGVADKDFDMWNKRRYDVSMDANQELQTLLEKDLPIRVSVGKKLVNAPLRGINSSEDLFRRIHQGINGTPMPAIGPTSTFDQGALSEQEIADITAYVATLVLMPEREVQNDD